MSGYKGVLNYALCRAQTYPPAFRYPQPCSLHCPSNACVKSNPALQQKWLKIVPHVIDTVLIGLGFAMVAQVDMALFANGWLTAKLVGLVAYIGLGIVAIKRGKTTQIKGFAAASAVVVFLYIFGVAKAHHPLSWLQYF